jgi:hypothetical protein
MFTAKFFHYPMAERVIACTENIGSAENGGLQDRVVVRVADDRRHDFRKVHYKSRGFQGR